MQQNQPTSDQNAPSDFSSAIGLRKMSLSLQSSSGTPDTNFNATGFNPIEDLKKGLYDITLSKGSQNEFYLRQVNSDPNDWAEMESRIGTFLDSEQIQNVMLDSYLKALGKFSESCNFSNSQRNHLAAHRKKHSTVGSSGTPKDQVVDE